MFSSLINNKKLFIIYCYYYYYYHYYYYDKYIFFEVMRSQARHNCPAYVSFLRILVYARLSSHDITLIRESVGARHSTMVVAEEIWTTSKTRRAARKNVSVRRFAVIFFFLFFFFIDILFCTVLSILWYKDQNFYHDYLHLYGVSSKMKYVKLIQNGGSKMADGSSSFLYNK